MKYFLKKQKNESSLEKYSLTENRDTDFQHVAIALLRPDSQFPDYWATTHSPQRSGTTFPALCRADAFWSSCLQTAHGGAAPLLCLVTCVTALSP